MANPGRNRYLGREQLEQRIYARGSGPLAFLDESYRGPDERPGELPFYSMTAVLVDRDRRDTIRDSVLPFADENGYWHANEAFKTPEGRERISGFLEHLNTSEVDSVVTVQTEIRPHQEMNSVAAMEAARAECLSRLSHELTRGREPVQHLVMESLSSQYNPGGNRKDQDTIHRAREAGLIPERTSINHASPTDEPLLWIPDAVSWAYRRQVAVDDSEWFQRVEIARVVHARGMDITQGPLTRRSPHLPQQSPGALPYHGPTQGADQRAVSSPSSVQRPSSPRQGGGQAPDPNAQLRAMREKLQASNPSVEDRVVESVGGRNVRLFGATANEYLSSLSRGEHPNRDSEESLSRAARTLLSSDSADDLDGRFAAHRARREQESSKLERMRERLQDSEPDDPEPPAPEHQQPRHQGPSR